MSIGNWIAAIFNFCWMLLLAFETAMFRHEINKWSAEMRNDERRRLDRTKGDYQ